MNKTPPTASDLLTSALVRDQATPAVRPPSPAELASGANIEIASTTFDALASASAKVGLKRQWSAVDVYVSLERPFPLIAQAGIIGCSVFARAGSSGRTLVATGAMRPFQVAGNIATIEPVLIAGARLEPSLYDVEIFSSAPNATNAPKCTVTLVGTHNTAAVPERVGGLSFDTDTGSILWGVGNTPLFRRELLWFSAASLAGAGVSRWMQYFDTSGAVPNGSVPDAVWAIPPDGSIDVRPLLERARRAPNLRASSTPGTLTVAADVFLSAFVR